MDYLQELVRIVNKRKIRNIAVLEPSAKSKSQVNRLYNAIAEHKVSDDEEAALLLFGNKKDKRYKKVKHQLKNRLLNTVFFIDAHQRQLTEGYKVFYNVYRQYMCAQILWRREGTSAAVHLLEKLLPKAIEYEFTEVVVGAARSLRYYYGVLNVHKKRYTKYRDIAREWEDIQYRENRVRDYCEELMTYFANTADEKMRTMAHSRSQEMASELVNYGSLDTVDFNFSRYFILVVLHMSGYNYRATIETCKQAIAFLDQKKNTLNGYKRIFLLQIVASSIVLKDYEEGEQAIHIYLQQVIEYSSAWFNIQELRIILYLYSERYEEAEHVFYTCYKKSKLKTLVPAIQERWHICSAYLHWLRSIGKITSELPTNKVFRLQKFLNQVPINAKDKSGMNLTILIIQTLWLVNKEQYEKARAHIEHLQRYNSRYLKKKSMQRTRIFVKMISQLSRGNFHQVAVQRKAKYYHKKLLATPLSMANQSFRLEIIPYEKLWEYLIEILDRQLH